MPVTHYGCRTCKLPHPLGERCPRGASPGAPKTARERDLWNGLDVTRISATAVRRQTRARKPREGQMTLPNI